jgi:hypothetical protein
MPRAALLAAAPWLLGFAPEGRRFWMPHLLAGSGVMGVAALSRNEPDDARSRRRRVFANDKRLWGRAGSRSAPDGLRAAAV